MFRWIYFEHDSFSDWQRYVRVFERCTDHGHDTISRFSFASLFWIYHFISYVRIGISRFAHIDALLYAVCISRIWLAILSQRESSRPNDDTVTKCQVSGIMFDFILYISRCCARTQVDSYPFEIVDDDCCFGHSTALTLTLPEHVEIVYANFHCSVRFELFICIYLCLF